MKLNLFIFISVLFGLRSLAQSFPGPVGDTTTTAVFKDDPRVDYWLEDSVQITRGYIDISDPGLGYVTYGDNAFALGESDPNVISLGDGGSAIYVLANPISDKDGYDFAVFENAFDNYFLELAFVEVSTNGVDYVRFNNQSNVDSDVQTGSFGATYTEDIHNLAGKYRAQYGTPFDLSELSDSSDIDIMNINYIKIIDVVGSVQTQYASYDSYGNIINDPWPTPFNSSGFDLDGIAILKPNQLHVTNFDHTLTYINNQLFVNGQSNKLKLCVFDLLGNKVRSEENILNGVDLNDLPKGIYIVIISGDVQVFNMKINIE